MKKRPARSLTVSLIVVMPLFIFWVLVDSWAKEQPTLNDPDKTYSMDEGGFTGTVVETINSGGYTYVHVDTGSKKIWAATPVFKVKVGKAVVVPSGLPMHNFHSKTLKREFELVYFVGAIMSAGERGSLSQQPGMPEGHLPIGLSTSGSHVEIGRVEKAQGGKTVAEIITGKEALVGKEILVRGRVVKFSPKIMGKNWLHVQDGSGSEGTNDLTVTTDNAMVKVGDIVLITGVVSVDRDFGFGYKYSVIIEGAKLTVE